MPFTDKFIPVQFSDDIQRRAHSSVVVTGSGKELVPISSKSPSVKVDKVSFSASVYLIYSSISHLIILKTKRKSNENTTVFKLITFHRFLYYISTQVSVSMGYRRRLILDSLSRFTSNICTSKILRSLHGIYSRDN